MKFITILLIFFLIPIAQQPNSAFQTYENGYMVWDSQTGTIYVFLREGSRLLTFPESRYENLPNNPAVENPPAGRYQPHSGFGRVWYHFVREDIGWAVAPEQAFDWQGNNFPDGRQVALNGDTWQFVESPAPDLPTPRPISDLPAETTMPAAYQDFERGFMLYWSDTGTIWVLYDYGRAFAYDSLLYGNLPLDPITQNPPRGLHRPILGFGKVWGHIGDVFNGLGWATAPEESYTMTFERIFSPIPGGSAISFIVSLPDGSTIRIYDSGRWE
jgi:hypothetical protein